MAVKNAAIILILFGGYYSLLQANPPSWLSNKNRLFQEIQPNQKEPTLTVEKIQTGHVLELILDTDNFKFSEACNTSPDEELMGHAHIYIDGKKVGTVYEPKATLVLDEPGIHQVTVTLNALPSHRFLSINGKAIQRVFEVTVP